MAKPLGAARAVAAQRFISGCALAPLPHTPPEQPTPTAEQTRAGAHEDAFLAEEDEERPRGVVQPRHAPEQQGPLPTNTGGSSSPATSGASAGGLRGVRGDHQRVPTMGARSPLRAPRGV
jgi:hypothetical protein